MDSALTCCLCNFEAVSDAEMENHIDVSHADIFCLDNNDNSDNNVINDTNSINDNSDQKDNKNEGHNEQVEFYQQNCFGMSSEIRIIKKTI